MAEHQRNDSFKLWCLRRLSGTARRSKQSILKEISPKYSLEGLMLKLNLQYYGQLMERADSMGKTLMLGKIEGKRRSGQQGMKWLDSITDSMNVNLSKLQEIVRHGEAWGAKVHRITKSCTWLRDWTATILKRCTVFKLLWLVNTELSWKSRKRSFS